MTTAEAETATVAAATEKPKGTKKPRVGAQRAPVAPAKAKSATSTKKTAKGAKTASTARSDSKKATVIDMLRRKDGASLADIMKATGWQSHSVRGFISGALIKKARLKVESFKRENGERAYAIRG